MDRRTLLKGVAALGAGLLLPPTLAENVEAATRRYWALGGIPGPRDVIVTGPFDAGMAFQRVPLHATVHWDDGPMERVPVTDLGDGRWRVRVDNSRGASFHTSVHWMSVPSDNLLASYTTQRIPPEYTRVDCHNVIVERRSEP
jgi:hypothetical protein